MNIKIIYEDDYIVAVNKPAGLVVHPGVGTKYTLTDWIQKEFPKMEGVGEPYYNQDGDMIQRPGIVHRLDKDTSGVLILAKDQDTFYTLKKHFQKGKIRKEYHSFVYGSPRNERGIISLPIGKSRSDFRKQAARNIRGEQRDAITEYVYAGKCEGNTSFIRFYPHTGRTHQIRVHAQNLQIPIICDTKYANGRASALGFERLALHARRVSISTHMYDKPLHILAPYPKDFQNALKLCSLVSKEVIE